MESEKNIHRQKIYSQIEEQYGKLVYTYTCHLKDARIISKKLSILKWFQIILSASSTVGIVMIIFGNNFWGTLISGLMSVALLIINSYLKVVDLSAISNRHLNSSNELWILREKYISLLVDFDTLSDNEIKQQRDILMDKTVKIYDSQLQTSACAYKKTQRALKKDEEQFFTQDELNKMLPDTLRK